MCQSPLVIVSQVAEAVAEDGIYLLMGQLGRGLEEPTRRSGAAAVTTHFCKTSRLDFQEHVPQLLAVRLLTSCSLLVQRCAFVAEILAAPVSCD